MDMIATLNTPALTVLLEGATVSQALIDDLSAAARDYTALTVQTSLNPFASDHVPFINAGLPALLTIEGADSANHNIHSANDTLANMGNQVSDTAKFVKLAIAFGVELGSDGPVVAGVR